MSGAIQSLSILLMVAYALVGSIEAQRQNPRAKETTNKQHNETACGTLNDLAQKIEVCAKPLMDVLEGSLEKWPSNEAETADYCQAYAVAERCIREHGRKCARGLQRQIISTLANSVQRARKRECVKGKLQNILLTTQCMHKHQKDVQEMVARVTARFSVIEKDMDDLDQKTNAVCCMVEDIEKEVKALLDPFCKEGSATVVRLYRATVEDVTQLICRRPNCKDVFKGYTIPQFKHVEPVGIIAILLRILFSLG